MRFLARRNPNYEAGGQLFHRNDFIISFVEQVRRAAQAVASIHARLPSLKLNTAWVRYGREPMMLPPDATLLLSSNFEGGGTGRKRRYDTAAGASGRRSRQMTRAKVALTWHMKGEIKNLISNKLDR